MALRGHIVVVVVVARAEMFCADHNNATLQYYMLFVHIYIHSIKSMRTHTYLCTEWHIQDTYYFSWCFLLVLHALACGCRRRSFLPSHCFSIHDTLLWFYCVREEIDDKSVWLQVSSRHLSSGPMATAVLAQLKWDKYTCGPSFFCVRDYKKKQKWLSIGGHMWLRLAPKVHMKSIQIRSLL